MPGRKDHRSICLFLAVSTILNIFLVRTGFAQAPPNEKLLEKYANAVDKKLSTFSDDADSYSIKTIDKVIGQEKLMQQKVAKLDSAAAVRLFSYSIDSLNKLKSRISGEIQSVNKYLNSGYFSYLDTLKQSLSFLKNGSDVLAKAGSLEKQFASSLSQVKSVEASIENVENIQNYLTERQQVLNNALAKFPQISNNLQKIGADVYYYKAQISEYKSSLKDPEKAEKLLMDQLEKLPAFQKYIQQNSQLAGLFPSLSSIGQLPGIGSVPIVSGIANRAVLQQYFNTNLPSVNGKTAMQQMQKGLPEGAGQLDQLNKAVPQSGTIANGQAAKFTPNTQKTKPFGKRIQWGTDIQFSTPVNYLPATANLALTAAYKLNDKFSAGLGISYILGLGSGWNHIAFSSQGIGLRSFLDYTVTKGWAIQGGAEWNYMNQFYSLQDLRKYNAWQMSALIGLCKTYKVGKMMSGNLQLLFDALYAQHIPNTQPIIFRFGYNF